MDKAFQLYSGNPKDSVPFLGFSIHEGKVTIKIPGGNKLELEPHWAMIQQWCINRGIKMQKFNEREVMFSREFKLRQRNG